MLENLKQSCFFKKIGLLQIYGPSTFSDPRILRDDTDHLRNATTSKVATIILTQLKNNCHHLCEVGHKKRSRSVRPFEMAWKHLQPCIITIKCNRVTAVTKLIDKVIC